ncbi:MAG: hypothetical protein MUP66_03170 [Candidatus Nanohaloarchaeota archaeon QJJ-5]|nr:hypothetical protein [Candidatus Nanohaloarchaeota archaeon QJJ-5]
MEKDIDFDELEYATNRKLPNDDDELTGHIKMYSYDGVNFSYQMTCPYCGAETEGEKEMPNRPYYIKCSECETSSLVRKLKGQGSKVKRPGKDDDDDAAEAADKV